MSSRHIALAILIAGIWGANFVALSLALEVYPPLLLAALRFGLLAIPTVLLVRRPRVPWRWLIGYGTGFGIVQFTFLNWGLSVGMPAGLASLTLQASAPFTALAGRLFFREKLTKPALVGIGIAIIGLFTVGWQRSENAELTPFLLTLCGAAGWAIGNVSARQAHTDEPIKLMLWMTVIPPLPMLILSIVFEGPDRIKTALSLAITSDGIKPTLALLFTVIVATVIASGMWTWLMSRHSASIVAPFSLLVPIFGMPAAWVAFGELVSFGELFGAALVLAGVLLGAYSRAPKRPPARQARAVKKYSAAAANSKTPSNP